MAMKHDYARAIRNGLMIGSAVSLIVGFGPLVVYVIRVTWVVLPIVLRLRFGIG